ncbi:hypothetical protein GGS23DRAFT_562679 [Durotheca rogersii]|uniref:uncharacterized protein n=1 Tax=Durotheca rogersii TaxID=419775 RepID=UPI00221F575B|nr:uncharacterized protein GGS23DRAFT_562679 [Durotheca rogersii]KAI5864042.1 hypothetical protein GGS23DRAFT_562679 [Durotheca rogersii]
MKIIITGATGFAGGALVRQAVANNKITHAFVLTRRPLPEELSKHAKLTVTRGWNPTPINQAIKVRRIISGIKAVTSATY